MKNPGPNTALFTRFTRRRNFAGFPFWVSASPETCSILAARARDYASSQTSGGQGFGAGIRLADCSPETLGLYREQGLLPERPVSFEGKRDFKMFFPGTDAREHALFGEVEHWTRVNVVAGMPDPGVNGAVTPAKAGASLPNPASAIPFARSNTYGFLTSNPAYAGTGLQIEAGLHLPALAADKRDGRTLQAIPIQAIQRALGALGYDLQPLTLRLPGSAESGYFRLLSRGGMDLPEETLYGNFAARAAGVLAAEAGALEQWHKREPNRLEDRVHRALRLLQEARRMDYAELLSLASYTRIGVYLGIFPESLREVLETLRVEAQPFHLQNGLRKALPAGSAETAPEDLDKARADGARGLLAGIQPL